MLTLLEFPVYVREEVGVPAVEHSLLFVVLGDRCVAFVDGDQCVWAEMDQVVV